MIISSFLIIAFISVFLLLKNNTLYNGSDTQFNLKRIVELRESIIHGSVFPDISLNEFHGSIVMSLYPYLNLFPAVLLSFIFKSEIIYVYVFFMFNTLLTLLISFYSSKKYTLSYFNSYVFSIIYSVSNLFLNYSIKGNDFGIVSTYILFPLIFFSFLNIINGKNNWIQLSIGMSLLLYSHILNLLIIGLFLLIICILNIRDLNKYIMNNIFKAITLFIILTSIIWLPLIHAYFINFNNINMPVVKELNNVSVVDFLKGIVGSNTNGTIGFFPTISIFLSSLFYKRFDKYIKKIYILSIIIILCVLFLPWEYITSFKIFKFLNQFQYTWRFLIIPQMTLSFIFSLVVTQYMKYYKYKLSILSILFAIIIQLVIGQYTTIKLYANNPTMNHIPKDTNKLIDIGNYYNYRINNTNQFNLLINSYHNEDDDYIPKSSIPISKYVNRNLGFYNDYYQIKVSHIEYNTFSFSSNKNNMSKLSLPIYSYNKEKLHVFLNDKLINSYTDKNGLLTIDNIQNNIKSNNEIYILPTLNSFRIIGVALSIFGWLLTLMILFKRKFIN